MTKSYYRAISSQTIRFSRIVFLFSILIIVPSVMAGTRAVNLAEMTARAGRIVYGQVSEVRDGVHPQNARLAVTFIKVRVTETLKGADARELSFMQFGNSTQQYAVHLPKYIVGEEIVLFLYPESKLGFTSPIGEGQGKFLVRNDVRSGKRLLQNEQLNRTLFAGLDSTKLNAKLALSRSERELVSLPESEASRGVEFSAFRSIVRKMTTTSVANLQ